MFAFKMAILYRIQNYDIFASQKNKREKKQDEFLLNVVF